MHDDEDTAFLTSPEKKIVAVSAHANCFFPLVMKSTPDISSKSH
jgi:hypothetical protein